MSFAQKSKKLLIKGTDVNSELIIKQLAPPEYIADSLLTLKIRLFTEKLDYLGFLNYQIDSTYTNDSLFYYRFDLKKPISKVSIKLKDKNLLSLFSSYQLEHSDFIEIDFTKLSSFIADVRAYYNRNGQVFAQVYFDRITKNKTRLTTQLIVVKEKKRFLDKIVIQGYADFPKSFITYHLNLKKGTVFNQSIVSEVSTQLKQLSFVSEIRKPELLFTKDSTAVYLYLKKEKSNNFDGLVGFSNAEEKGVQLNGYLNLNIQNAFNSGTTLDFKWLADGKQVQSLDLSFHYPYLYKTPISSQYDFALYKKDSSFITVSHRMLLDYQLKKQHKIGFTLESNLSNSIALNTNNSDYNNLFYGVSYEYNKPIKHPIFKNKWFLHSDFSKGERENIPQTKISNELIFLGKLTSKQFFRIKNHTALLISDNYLDNELFRIGGANSIRGFDERSLLAQSYSYFNFSYGYIVGEGAYLSALSDYGLLKQSNLENTLQVYSFGLGYHFSSKIGRVGLQYFMGNTSEHSFSFGSSKLHVQLVQEF